MDYDDFGRIMRLLRYDGKGRAIDSLAYQYLNNTGRLGHVRDGVGSEVSGNDVDNQMPNNYAYDASGNMTQDLGSGIGEIRYNPYNLPTTLIKSGQTYQYRYDGSGKRIEKVQPNGSFESYRRGANGELLAIYDNFGGLKQFELDGMGEARFETGDAQQKGGSGATSGNWQFLYYDKDVIGNLRLIVSQDGSIIRTTDLDPWGYEYEPVQTNLNGTNTKWKFLSKEQDTESGYYDLDARKYQSSLGLFLGVEPLYGKYVFMTPFGYGLNNPLRFTDKSGFEATEEEDGRFKKSKELKQAGEKIVGDTKFLRSEDGTTYCNFAFQELNQMAGDHTFDNMTANEMNDFLTNPENATELNSNEAVFYAGEGAIVAASSKGAQHGHIAAVAPEGMVNSPKYGGKVPQIYNVGINNGLGSLSMGFSPDKSPKFFILNSDKKAIDDSVLNKMVRSNGNILNSFMIEE